VSSPRRWRVAARSRSWTRSVIRRWVDGSEGL